jgi:hypothetical protein
MAKVNTNVFTGADGSIALSASQDTVEGKAAQTVLDAYELIAVGRVHDVTVQVQSEVRAFHEIGQRYATELRSGNMTIKGTIGRAHINGALLRLMLGEAAESRPARSWPQPTFNITFLAENAAAPGVKSSITLHDVKIDNWVLNVPEDDFLMESVGFQALYLTTLDEVA